MVIGLRGMRQLKWEVGIRNSEGGIEKNSEFGRRKGEAGIERKWEGGMRKVEEPRGIGRKA